MQRTKKAQKTNGSNSLEYSCCNEDSRSELTALRPKGRRVLSIAAAGGRAFSLLVGEPKEVIAIDANRQQINLCLLKYQAIKQLNRDEYLSFVGIGFSNNRLKVYDQIRGNLPDEASRFWDSQADLIDKGILYAGSFDRYVIKLSKVFRIFTWWAYQRLRSCKTVEEQVSQLSVPGSLRDRFLRILFKCMYNPRLAKPMHLDAGAKESRREAGTFFLESLRSCLRNHLFDDCFQLQLFVQGRLTKEGSLPFHLESGHYEAIRQRLDRLSFHCSDIGSYLENEPPETFGAFSLSDLSSYLSPEEVSLLLARVERASTNGARICMREYVAPLDRRVTWPSNLQRNRNLEKELGRMDRVLGYTFICAEVQK